MGFEEGMADASPSGQADGGTSRTSHQGPRVEATSDVTLTPPLHFEIEDEAATLLPGKADPDPEDGQSVHEASMPLWVVPLLIAAVRTRFRHLAGSHCE